MPDLRHTRLLYTLGAVLILAGIGTALWSSWPDVSYRLGLINDDYPYPSTFAEESGEKPRTSTMPQGQRVVIPKIGVDVQIFDTGAPERGLDLGVWRHPETALPGQAANMALAGHRSRRQFALLYALRPGDEIIVYWDGEEYDYVVTGSREVTPDDTTALDSGRTEALTLYTCTPRFLGNLRTVVTAQPVAR